MERILRTLLLLTVSQNKLKGIADQNHVQVDIRHVQKWNLEWILGAEIKPDKPEILLLTKKLSMYCLFMGLIRDL